MEYECVAGECECKCDECDRVVCVDVCWCVNVWYVRMCD